MAKCECLCCNHPIVKKAVEFYCIIWGVIGIVFLIMMVWSLFQFKTLAAKGAWWMMGQPGSTQNQQGATPGYNWR
jgi:hypothetical protein